MLIHQFICHKRKLVSGARPHPVKLAGGGMLGGVEGLPCALTRAAAGCQGSIQACRESRRRMDRAIADYDAASKRYLGQSKLPGRWRSDSGDKSDKARLDMLHAEVCDPGRSLPDALLCIFQCTFLIACADSATVNARCLCFYNNRNVIWPRPEEFSSLSDVDEAHAAGLPPVHMLA